MAQTPMLEIKGDQTDPKRVTANLLPCRVHHTGSVDPIAAYWSPEAKDGAKTAYFRGRKLTGKAVTLPEGYRGAVLKQDSSSRKSEREDVAGEDEAPETKQMQVVAEFDEVVVWGHGEVPDAATDPYLRGVDEWLQLAAKIHCDETPEASPKGSLA